jgi:hypothetical protein
VVLSAVKVLQPNIASTLALRPPRQVFLARLSNWTVGHSGEILASELTLLRIPQLSMCAGAPQEETQHAQNHHKGTPCEVELAVDVKITCDEMSFNQPSSSRIFEHSLFISFVMGNGVVKYQRMNTTPI